MEIRKVPIFKGKNWSAGACLAPHDLWQNEGTLCWVGQLKTGKRALPRPFQAKQWHNGTIRWPGLTEAGEASTRSVSLVGSEYGKIFGRLSTDTQWMCRDLAVKEGEEPTPTWGGQEFGGNLPVRPLHRKTDARVRMLTRPSRKCRVCPEALENCSDDSCREI